MASDIPKNDSQNSSASSNDGDVGARVWQAVVQILKPLASLKITVVLFLMAIFIIFVGTLAQQYKDIWQVVHDYFRMDLGSVESALASALAWIDFRILQSFFLPGMEPAPWGYGFFFPSGWLIGLGLFINLTAAHLIRFRIQGSGTQLLVGIVLIIVGCIVTGMVIMAGSYQTGTQPELFSEWPSLRILWLLVQCTFAGLVLLAGHWLVFRKRAGIVLLHLGIGLLMLGELLVGIAAVESQIQIIEGQTVNFAMDSRQMELALIDTSDPEADEVFAIPQSRFRKDEVISDESLPVAVEVLAYMPNSSLRRATPADKNLATQGAGLREIAKEIAPISGTDRSGRSNRPTAYVRFLDKDSQEPLAVLRLSLIDWMTGRAERLNIGDRTLNVQLRYKHDYKPFSMHLVNVEQQVYMGTQTAKSYASEIRLVDPEHNVDREVRIWMNNPLRYRGATFYQSNYGTDPASRKEYTGLQVVTNTGWRIPYVSCMIVAIGMLAQFWVTLSRYLTRRASQPAILPVPQSESRSVASERRASERREKVPASLDGVPERRSIWSWVVPLGVVLVCGLWIASKARLPNPGPNEIDFTAFGSLPVTYEGRIKPLDTLARTSLRKISDRQTYSDGDEKSRAKQPAIRWLLDVITDSSAARDHKVFRIHNLDVLETLGLERRKGFRYAINEFSGRLNAFEEQTACARGMRPEERDLYARKILDLDSKLNEFLMLQEAFRLPQLRAQNLSEDLAREGNRRERFASFAMPLAIPPQQPGGRWEAYTFALFDALAQKIAAMQELEVDEPNPATMAFLEILGSYDQGGKGAATFNQKVREYQQVLAELPMENWQSKKIRFETWFNHAAPLYYCMILYLFAFVLGCFAWFGWTGPLRKSSIWLCIFTWIVHTLALTARMYISGRPPITTLYTSALFVGWISVGLGLLMERYSKIGVANVVAAMTGFIALLIGYKLTTDVATFKGDTFTVLVAVLDTNFWLATHVTCVTAGYGATFFAGFLGFVYIIRGVFTPSLTPTIGAKWAA